MIVINKNKNKVINLGSVNEIFKGADGFSIKVNFTNGQGTQIERYNSAEATDIALEMLCNAIGKTDKFIMPNDEQIKAHILTARSVGTEYHNRYNGAKQKRHGGS
jgi:hypothetical protein